MRTEWGLVPAAWALLLAPGAAPAGSSESGDDGARYVDVSLEPEGRLLDAHFVDLEGDGQVELCMAVLSRDGARELQLFRLVADGHRPSPFRVVPVLDDAVAWLGAQGVHVVRVHDVKEMVRVVRVVDAIERA